jgi:DNA-binding CsgD family transcriptional regulator/PAS domain-containing protein
MPMASLLATAEELAGIGGWELDLDTLEGRWTDGMYRIHGLAPQSAEPGIEMLLERVHPCDRDRVAALLRSVLDAPEALVRGVAGEYRAVLPDRSVRRVRYLGRVETDGPGGRRRWLGASHDVTAVHMLERELGAHHAVSQALREWASFDEGAECLLRRVAVALDYPCGALWLWDRQAEALRCRAFWQAPGTDVGAFESSVRAMRFAPGEGKAGTTWLRHEPVLTPDVASDPVSRPREAALAGGICSAVAFPAVALDGPIAVVSLYSLEPRAVSESLMRTLTSIGRELGRFLAARRAQLGPQPLSSRELQVLALAAEGRTGPQIAALLSVSPSTVKSHLEHNYDKLGVGDRAGAVATALRSGLLE